MRKQDNRPRIRDDQPSLLFGDTMNGRPLPKTPPARANDSWAQTKSDYDRSLNQTYQGDTSRNGRNPRYYEEAESQVSYRGEGKRDAGKGDIRSMLQGLESGMATLSYKMEEVGLKVDGMARRLANVETRLEHLGQASDKVNIDQLTVWSKGLFPPDALR